MLRSIPCFTLPWLLMAHAALAGSDRPSPLPLGSIVLAKRPGIRFRIESNDAGEMYAGLAERVQKVQGDWLWLGRGWVQRRDLVPIWEAVEYFTAEIERKPTSFAHVARAVAVGRRGAFAVEIDGDIDKALALEPNFAAAHLARGAALLARGELDQAIDSYDDAIRFGPDLAEAYNDRGGAWYSKKRLDKALKDLDQAIRLCPRLASAYANRSIVFAEKADYERAIADAQESLKHDPYDSLAYLNLGLYWLAKSDDERATANFSEAIRLDPKSGKARYQRGKIYSRLGDLQKAIVDLNQAVQLLPRNAEVLQARGYVYYRLGAIEKSNADRIAVARLRRTDAIPAENNADSTETLRSSFIKNFAVDEKIPTVIVKPPIAAEGQLATPSTITPSTSPPLSTEGQQRSRVLSRATPLNNAAWRAATSSDERYLNGERAVAFATEACELTDWKQGGFIDTLAAAYAEMGDFEAAIKWQTKAIELLATSPTIKAEAEQRLELYRSHQPYREGRPLRLARDPNAEGDVE